MRGDVTLFFQFPVALKQQRLFKDDDRMEVGVATIVALSGPGKLQGLWQLAALQAPGL